MNSDNEPKKKKHAARAKNTKPAGAPAHRYAYLVGVAIQETDGHKRITQGQKFTLLGGTQETHAAMTETVVKTFEDLKRKGKTIDEADPREIGDLLKKNAPKI